MYCSIQDLRDILPKSITIGDATKPSVSDPKANSISLSQANKYIYYATQYIDARLCQIYYTPISQLKKVTVDILANMLPNSTDVIVSSVGGLYVGACVILEDDNGTETCTVSAVPETWVSDSGSTVANFNHITLSFPSKNAYDAGSHGRLHLLVYPDPLPVLTARLACSFLFDKLFTADQAPDVSNYGKALRNMAITDMNAILGGQVRLDGQELCSRRFVRGTLFDSVRLALDTIPLEQGMQGG